MANSDTSKLKKTKLNTDLNFLLLPVILLQSNIIVNTSRKVFLVMVMSFVVDLKFLIMWCTEAQGNGIK